MPRRRPAKDPVVTRTRDQVRQMLRYAIEDLEPRTLFNTITGDGVFEYKDATSQIVRVRFHNVQAELVFARVDRNTNEVVLGDATPSFAQEEDGKDLFHIYVAQAGADSFISIAEVPAITNPIRPMQPFAGSVTLTIAGRGGLQSVTTAGESGAIYLGAKTKDTPAQIANEINRPILTDQFFGLGILGPRPSGRLTAGINIESGVDLGKLYFGGTISGQVTIGGSMDQFYAGSLLTGDTRGFRSNIPDNFLVAGDLRELIVMGSIGTHADSQGGLPIYQTDFDLQVNGTLGRVISYNHIIGNIHALNDPATPRLRMNQTEIEAKVFPRLRGSDTHFEGSDTFDFDFDDPQTLGEQPRLGDNQAEFNNDTFETAQYLGTFNSRTLGNGSINVNGRLQNLPEIEDDVDYFGVPLMAGQTIAVRLLAPLETIEDFGELPEDTAEAFLTIFDPDGRLIGSDANNVDPDATLNRIIQFTADRPGVYRFAANARRLLANINYQLQMQNVGVMTIGAIQSAGEIFGTTSGRTQIQASRGDLGVIAVGSTLAYAGAPAPFDAADIFVDGGNLRAVDTAQIGFAQNDNGFGPNFAVTGGSIGLFMARTGLMNLESVFVKDTSSGIGGDVQLISAEGPAPIASLFMELHVDGALGVVRTTSMDTIDPSVIDVNYDQRGGDGVIDLIDVGGDMGNLAAGGPAISTGPGGNVRYIHVGGQTFRDVFFGGGEPDITNYAPGEEVTFTDDSGTQMFLAPTPGRTINPDGSTNPNAGRLTVVQYPIRSSPTGGSGGGNVLVRLDSSQGVEVFANGQSGRGTAEIGEINTAGVGRAIREDRGFSFNDPKDDFLELAPDTGATIDLNIEFHGNAVTDVYEIVGGNFSRITNHTGGEIVNADILSVADLSATTLGLSKSNSGTLTQGLLRANMNVAPTQEGPTPDAGPFTQQRIGIHVDGDVISARSLHGMGNFYVRGTIQELVANADGVPAKGIHEGINAPIMTQAGGAVTSGGGEIRHINIGEGILPSGTGSVLYSGIFAHSRIGEIINQGEGSDIRGDIVSKGENLPFITRDLPLGGTELIPLAPIGTISLFDGAILGADIMVVSDFENARELGGGPVTTPDYGEFQSEPVFEIEAIGLSGKGGIMSAAIVSNDVGTVEVKDGFGIFNSFFSSTAQGDIGNIITDGYGIRTSAFFGGGSINLINARGNGARLNANDYTMSVRFSDRLAFDPYSGYVLSELNDLHRYLGTTGASPVVTKGDYGRSGIIDEVDARGSRELRTVHAQQIKNTNFAFGSATDVVVVRDYMDTVFITSGRLNYLSTGSDVHNAEWSIAGPVGVVGIGGVWRGTSRLAANGPNGQINTFATGRSMFGTVISQNDIALVRVGTDFGAPGFFNQEGQRTSAGLDVGRNLNNLIIRGSILADATIFVDNHLGFITLGADVQEEALVSVWSLGGQQIGGQVFGDFEIRSQN